MCHPPLTRWRSKSRIAKRTWVPETARVHSAIHEQIKGCPRVEIMHRVWIDGNDVEYWRGRGLTMKPIRSAFYEDGTAKTWISDVSESSSIWPELKMYIGSRPHFLNTFFTDEERLAAEWCILRGIGPIRPTKPVSGNWSQEYYKGQCSVCGSGWTQIAPFHLTKEPKLGRNAFGSFSSAAYELFATDEVFRTFESEEIRGVDSWPIVDGKDKHTADHVRQLLVRSMAAPALEEEMVEHEHFRSSACAACGTTWHLFYSRGMLPLRRSALRSDVDFQMTHEWFGSGRAARHEILVTNRVVQLILKSGWKGADLSPIQAV